MIFQFADEDKKYTKIAEGKVDTTKPSRRERLEKWKESKRKSNFEKVDAVVDEIKRREKTSMKKVMIHYYIKAKTRKNLAEDIRSLTEDETSMIFNSIFEEEPSHAEKMFRTIFSDNIIL